MRPLREDERDEIESLSHLIKHVLCKPNIQGFKIWEAVLELDRIGKKYVLSGIITEEELRELLELDDVKELMEKLFNKIRHYIKTGETK